jgi:hypothetical protein
MKASTVKVEYDIQGARYSIFLVPISAEFVFHEGWIELIELHMKKYISSLWENLI